MKQPKEVIILIAVVISLMIIAIAWTLTHNSRGKYHAPYKYYEGDRPNYNPR